MVRRYLAMAAAVAVSVAACAEIASVRDDLVLVPDGGSSAPGTDGATTGDGEADASSSDGRAVTPDGAVCREGETVCEEDCVDTQTDPTNCGTCKSVCKTSEVCDRGQCKGGCSGSLENCAGACVDTKTDQNHCGRCDAPCDSTKTCVFGACITTARDGGF